MDSQNITSDNIGTMNTTIYNGSSTTIYNGSSTSIYNESTTIIYNRSSTIYNGTTTENTTYSVLSNCIVMTVSLCSILCNSFASSIINRCRKLSFQIRFVSKNLLASFITFEISLFLHNLAMVLVGDVYYKQIFDSRTLFTCVSVTILWGSLCAVTVERLIALTIPLHYTRYVTKTVLSISIASLWTVNVLVPLIFFIFLGIKACGYDYTSCDLYAFYAPLGLVIICFLLLYSLIVIISYLKISFIIFQHNKIGRTLNANTKYLAYISQKQKVTDSTKIVATIILVFLFFQSPMYFHSILLNFNPEFMQQKWRHLLQIFDYVGIELNTYASMYLYIWKFKECKMHFYFMLSKFNKKYKATADDLHIQVYNIVISENKHRKKITMKDSKL